MEKLVVKEVPQPDAAAQVASFLNLPQTDRPQVVAAGAHSIRYERQGDIRFGPALYSATATGPRGDGISGALSKYPVLAPKSPYQSALGLYAFTEIRGNANGEFSSAVRIFDLELGRVVATQTARSAEFLGWRGGGSSEYIVQAYGANQSPDWFACEARGNFLRNLWKKNRFLFRGGYEGHVSADGRHLLVLDGRSEVFVALIAIDSGTVLDLKKAADFEEFVPNASALDTVRFDPDATRLTVMLNWKTTDYQANQVVFEKLVAIEIGNGASWR